MVNQRWLNSSNIEKFSNYLRQTLVISINNWFKIRWWIVQQWIINEMILFRCFIINKKQNENESGFCHLPLHFLSLPSPHVSALSSADLLCFLAYFITFTVTSRNISISSTTYKLVWNSIYLKQRFDLFFHLKMCFSFSHFSSKLLSMCLSKYY